MSSTIPREPTADVGHDNRQDEMIEALAAVGSINPNTQGERLIDEICVRTLESSPLEDVSMTLVDTAAARLIDVRTCERTPRSARGPHRLERDWTARRVSDQRPHPDIETYLYWNCRETIVITDRPIGTLGEKLDLLRIITYGSSILEEVRDNPIASVRGTGKCRFMMPLIRLDNLMTYSAVALICGHFPHQRAHQAIEWFWRFGTTLGEVSATQVARYLNGPYRQRPPEDLKLSVRETEVLAGIGDGLSNDEIADRLSISPGTIKTYRSRIREKTDVHTEAGLVKLAIRMKLTRL